MKPRLATLIGKVRYDAKAMDVGCAFEDQRWSGRLDGERSMSWNATTFGRLMPVFVSASLVMASPVLAVSSAVAFAREANAVCRDLLDQRDGEAFEAGTAAGVDLLIAHRTNTAPAGEEAERLAAALTGKRDQLAEALTRLETLHPPMELDADWAVFLADIADEVAILESRIDVVKDGSLDIGRILLGASAMPDALEQALIALGFHGRDCELVSTARGTMPDQRPFVASAARTCSAILERRAANGYADDAALSVNAIVDVREGRLEAAPELERALANLHAEWQSSLEDFTAVPAASVGNAEVWQEFLTTVAERVDIYGRRLAVVRSGTGNISQAYAAVGTFSRPGADFTLVGLAQTDCRRLTF